MRRITTTMIISGLLVGALVPAAGAHAARPLASADAERIGVHQVQVAASQMQARGAYQVTSTSHRCQRVSTRRIACNFALFLRGLTPQATDRLCLSTIDIVRTPGDRIVQRTAPLVCA